MTVTELKQRIDMIYTMIAEPDETQVYVDDNDESFTTKKIVIDFSDIDATKPQIVIVI